MTSRLQHEIKQTRPFSSLDQEVFLNILRTADALTRALVEVLKPAGLSPTQYNVLRILRGAGEDGLACQEIGHRLVTRDPDITRILDRLESRKLIGRHRSKADRRVVCSKINSAGLELLARLDQPISKLHTDLLAHMGKEKLTQLNQLLEDARGTPSSGTCEQA